MLLALNLEVNWLLSDVLRSYPLCKPLIVLCLASRLLVTDLGSGEGTHVNGTQLTSFSDALAKPGDIVSFGKLLTAFQLVPVFNPAQQQSPVKTALTKVKALQQLMPGDIHQAHDSSYQDADCTQLLRQLRDAGKHGEARELLLRLVVADSEDGALWARLADLERILAERSQQSDAKVRACRKSLLPLVCAIACWGGSASWSGRGQPATS